MKLFTIYLLIYLTGFQPMVTGICNFIYLPELAEHYQLHKTEYNNSFIEFLELHYGFQKKAHKDEHKDHENLPFQQGQFASSNFYFLTSDTFDIELIKPEEKIHHNFSYKSGFSFLNETDILQPPKY